MADTYSMVMELVDKVTPGLNDIKSKLAGVQTAAAGANGTLGKLGAIAGPVALGVTAIAGAALAGAAALNTMGRAGIEFGDAISDVAGKTGQTVEELQRLRLTAEANGGSATAMDAALLKFNVTLGQAQRGTGPLVAVLRQLNVQLTDGAGNLKSASTTFNEVRTAIGQLGTEAQKTAAISIAFGKTATELSEVFSMTEEQIAETDKAIRMYGGYLSGDMADASAAATDQLALIEKGTDTLTAKLQIAIGLPVSIWWAEMANKIAKTSVEFAKFIGLISKFDGKFGGAFDGLNDAQLAENLDATNKELATTQQRIAEIKKEAAEIDAYLPGGRTLATDVLEVGGALSRVANDNGWGDIRTEFAQLQDRAEQLTAAAAELERVQSTREAPAAAETTDIGIKALAALQLATQKSNAQAIADRKARAQAMYEIERDSIEAFRKLQIDSGNYSNTDKDKIDDLANQQQLAAQQKLANDIASIDAAVTAKRQAELAKRTEAQKKADEAWLQGALEREARDNKTNDGIAAISAKMNDQADTQDAIVNGTERQLELRRALNDAEAIAIANQRELTAGEREAIIAASERIAASDEQLKKFQDMKSAAERSADDIREIYKNAAQSIQGSFSDFFFDVMQGNLSDLADSFKRTIDRMVADMLAANLFKMVGGIGTGTAGESNLSGFFASIFGGISGRATGGPTTAGTPYWVGEEGPEIVIPSASSTVVPTDLSMAMASGSGSGGGTTVNNISIKALDSKSVIQLIEANDRDILNKLAEASQRYGVK